MSDDFEKQFWGNCTNTLGEELKQLVYARCMGLTSYHDGRSPFNFDMGGKSIIDIGGGPVSFLLKCTNLGACSVVDPLKFPVWVYERYELAKITCHQIHGEDVKTLWWSQCFDEAWIYNTLQHVYDPQLVIYNAKFVSHRIRLFEWIGLPPHPGHPHELKKELLDKWLGAPGKAEWVNESGCTGLAYYGVWNGTTI